MLSVKSNISGDFMGAKKYTRRALVSWLGTLAGGAVFLSVNGRSENSIVPRNLARPRSAQLPKGGTYDHQSQQMTGYDIKIADTGTDTDEDQEQSTTFWDGEKQ